MKNLEAKGWTVERLAMGAATVVGALTGLATAFMVNPPAAVAIGLVGALAAIAQSAQQSQGCQPCRVIA